MSDYELELPWPPSVNGYWRSFSGRQIISKRGRDYRKEVERLMQSYGLSNENITERLSVSIKLHPPTLRKYDLDNFNKAVFDALTHSNFWGDDEQVDRLTVTKEVKTPPGFVRLKINKLN